MKDGGRREGGREGGRERGWGRKRRGGREGEKVGEKKKRRKGGREGGMYLCTLYSLWFALSQILTGIYPIAQVREPYTAVGYLAQRTDLVQQLQLVHPEAPSPVFKKTAGKKVGDWEIEGVAACDIHVTDIHVTSEEEQEWTALDICDGMEVYSLYSCRYLYWCIVLYTNYKLPVCLLSHLLAWAIKRGYYTSRAAHPDTYRAGGCGFAQQNR